MAGTRSSSRLSGQPQSSPPQAQTPTNNGKKRKAETTPSSAKATKEAKTGEKGQKTLEDTLAGSNQEGDDQEQKDTEMKESTSPAHEPAKATGKDTHDGKPSCWFWSDKEAYPDEHVDNDKVTQAGDSFKGENREGESKSDPEKALKDSRGGPGLNALDDDKPVVEDVPHVSLFAI